MRFLILHLNSVYNTKHRLNCRVSAQISYTVQLLGQSHIDEFIEELIIEQLIVEPLIIEQLIVEQLIIEL